jgi:glycerophosphoryl diester phosphodiesterase
MVVKIAHRGDPLLVRENTLPSLLSAIDGGADWVEIDVKLTRDDVPVLLHDHTLERLWRIDRRLNDLSHAELDALVDDGEWQIPTLDEALTLAAEHATTVMVDVPGRAEGAAALAVVRGLGLLDGVAFAGDTRALVDIRAEAPGAHIALSWKSPLMPSRELLAGTRPDYLNLRHHALTRRIVKKAHAHGMKVCTWTVDRPRRMAALAAAGVDAIISNDIRTLVSTLT